MESFKEYINEGDSRIKEKKRWESKVSALLLKKLFIGGTIEDSIKRVGNVTKIKYNIVGFETDYGFNFEKKVQAIIDNMKETDTMLDIFTGIDYEIETDDKWGELNVTLIITYYGEIK
jgi:hypothetical protein